MEMNVEWRGAGESDLDAWVDALAVIEAVDRTGEVVARTDLEDQAALSYFDLERDCRLGWVDDEVVAWGTVICIPSSRQRRVGLAGAVVPAYRQQGIGTALVRWQVDRGREMLAASSETSPAWLELSAAEADVPRTELFRAFEFAPLRYYHEMRRPLGDPIRSRELAPDLALVPFDFARDEETRAVHNEAFEDHFAATVLDEETWHTWVTGDRHFDPGSSFLVLADNEIVGYSLTGVYPDEWEALGFREGWIHQLGVRRPWRGRGVATTLLAATATAFAAAGLEYAALDVDAENLSGALALYERAGYVRTKTRVSWSSPAAPLVPPVTE